MLPGNPFTCQLGVMRKSKDQGFRSQAGFSFLGAMVAAAFAGLMMGTTAVTYRAWETWGANERVKQRAQSATTLAQQLAAADIAPEMYQEVFDFAHSGKESNNSIVVGAAETNIKKEEKQANSNQEEESKGGDRLPLDGTTDGGGHILALVNKGVLAGRAPAMGRIISLPGEPDRKEEEPEVTTPLPRYYQADYAEVNLPGDPPGAGVSETPEGPVFDEDGRFYPFKVLPSENPVNTMYLVFAGDKLDSLPDGFTGDVGDESWEGAENSSVYSHNQWGEYERLTELYYTRATMPERLAVRAFPPPDNKDQYDPAANSAGIVYTLDNDPVVFRGENPVTGPESELLHFSAAEILSYWLNGRNPDPAHTLTVKQSNQSSLAVMVTGIWGAPGNYDWSREMYSHEHQDANRGSSQLGTIEQDESVTVFPLLGVAGYSLAFVWGVPGNDATDLGGMFAGVSGSIDWEETFNSEELIDSLVNAGKVSNPGWGNPYLAMSSEEETWELGPKVEQLPPPVLEVGE